MTILEYTTPCKRAGRLLLAAYVFFFLTPTAMAATYWVSAADGDDGADGLSLKIPFATIQKCADIKAAGNMCLIREGAYRATIRPAAGALHVNRYETVDWRHNGDFKNFHIARKNNADVFFRGRVPGIRRIRNG